MQLKTFFTIYSLVSYFFASVSLLAPDFLLNLLGTQSTPQLEFITRLFGSALVSLGAISSLGRKNSTNSLLSKNIIICLLLGELCGALVSFNGQIQNQLNYLGWLIFSTYFFLSLSLVYYLTKLSRK